MTVLKGLASVVLVLAWSASPAAARQDHSGHDHADHDHASEPPRAAEACAHGIAESRCPFCTPSLVRDLGMCREHGVAEALCVMCRPFLETAFVAAGDWCAEHARPESQCVLCGNGAAAEAAAGAVRRFKQQPSPGCTTAQTTVTLASPAAARTAGFEYADIRATNLSREVVRNAEIVYDARRYARLSSRAPGVIVEVLKDLGDRVEIGDVVSVVDSMALGSAKAELLQAVELLSLRQGSADREMSLMQKGAGTERAVLEAQTHLAEARIAVSRARQQLRNLGLSDEDIDLVIERRDTDSRLRITAPFAGTLVESAAVTGEVVDQRDMLFAIADTGTMWAMIDLTESDLANVRAGHEVTFRSDGLPDRVFAGRLTWISTQLDRKTRTIRARAELDNGGAALKAFMFGRATIRAGMGGQAITVPKSAVQWEGCCNVAFVRVNREGTIYQPARLTLGFDAGDRYEVLAGLSGGETVVTRGSYILKNEILKDAVGAGCCEVDHLAK
ncbi:MAG: efflux RND transporter periplasmic adaptor subunit [Phycisphaerales bacterium]|nr:efflux RND transporter periplasmic adaptor subunit [Phycisphaerales bacterium]